MLRPTVRDELCRLLCRVAGGNSFRVLLRRSVPSSRRLNSQTRQPLAFSSPDPPTTADSTTWLDSPQVTIFRFCGLENRRPREPWAGEPAPIQFPEPTPSPKCLKTEEASGGPTGVPAVSSRASKQLPYLHLTTEVVRHQQVTKKELTGFESLSRHHSSGFLPTDQPLGVHCEPRVPPAEQAFPEFQFMTWSGIESPTASNRAAAEIPQGSVEPALRHPGSTGPSPRIGWHSPSPC